MANLQQFATLKSEVKNIKDKYSYSTESLAFIHYVLEKEFPNIEVEDYITEGPGDKTIDAYNIDDDNNIHIFQFKYTEQFETHKTKSGLSEKDLSNIKDKISKIWNADPSIFYDCNEKTEIAIKDIQNKLQDTESRVNKIFLYLVSNYDETININSKNRIKEFKEEFTIDIKIYTIQDLLKKMSFAQDYKDISFNYTGNNFFNKTTGNVRAFIGEVNSFNFIEKLVYKNEDTIVLDELFFEENVRKYLQQNKINLKIEDSAKSLENKNFFFYNNGITLICENYNHNDVSGGVITLKKFQIVNGSQTIHSLFNVYKENPDILKNVDLLLRIYEVKEDRKIGQDIARYTNTQNPVKNRDILSNDERQINLQKTLFNQGYFYERKKNEYVEEEKNKRIDSEELAQILISFYLQKPGIAKNQKQKLFDDYYEEIFNANKLTSDYVLTPYLIYKKILNKINLLKEENGYEFLYYAKFYILSLFKFESDKKGIGENEESIINKIIDKIKNNISKEQIIKIPYIFKNEFFLEELKKRN